MELPSPFTSLDHVKIKLKISSAVENIGIPLFQKRCFVPEKGYDFVRYDSENVP